MKIRMIVLLVRNSGTLNLGQELELPDEEAIELVHQGHAEAIDLTPAPLPPQKNGGRRERGKSKQKTIEKEK
jgi:hypothetical protein